jgi:hypothetical protein
MAEQKLKNSKNEVPNKAIARHMVIRVKLIPLEDGRIKIKMKVVSVLDKETNKIFLKDKEGHYYIRGTKRILDLPTGLYEPREGMKLTDTYEIICKNFEEAVRALTNISDLIKIRRETVVDIDPEDPKNTVFYIAF